MPNGFNQMGNIPEGYDSLLNAARSQLVRMPDGSYQVAPQFGGSTSLDAIYGGILPSVPGPLTARSVPTYDVDSTGRPIVAQAPGFSAPTMARTRIEQSGSRPSITAGSQPGGMVPMPPGARPASVDRAFAQMQVPRVPLPGMLGRGQPTVWDPFGTQVAKDTSRLPTNAGEAEFLAAFGPQGAQSPAVTAIDQAAGMPPLPRIRPIPPALTPLTAVAPPAIPGPRSNAPASITFKKGDTVGALAKRYGMTVSSFADRYGIANPNRIYAGDTVSTRAPTLPRLPSPSVRAPQAKPRETFDSVWAEARG